MAHVGLPSGAGTGVGTSGLVNTPVQFPTRNVVSAKKEKLPKWKPTRDRPDQEATIGFLREFRTRVGLREPRLRDYWPEKKRRDQAPLLGIEIGRYSYGADLERMNHYRVEDEPLTIGSFCSIGPDVAFFAHTDHSIERTTTAPPHFFGATKAEGYLFKGPIIVGNDVWIGQRSMIMANVRIGDGAVISAGSVVTKDVAPYTVVGGVPAVLIKARFPVEVVRGLLEVSWWDWDHDKLRANRDVLTGRPEALLDRHLPGWRALSAAAE